MFKRLSNKNPVSFTFDGRHISACEGDSVAAAIVASGQLSVRKSHVSHSARGPFCMMGACYECLVQYNGKTVQACMLLVEPEMQITTVPVANLSTNTTHTNND